MKEIFVIWDKREGRIMTSHKKGLLTYQTVGKAEYAIRVKGLEDTHDLEIQKWVKGGE